MNPYDHHAIEKKWQDTWAENNTYATKDPATSQKNAFILDMFPYPSGSGLHVGHPRGYIATDVYARMKRMQGYNVLHPMGWDAFGLPAENHAIANKTHPSLQMAENIVQFKKQLMMMGVDYDWSHEINTTDPTFYKWTQWCFLQMYKKGLAYESHEPINWCPTCKTGLANEDLDPDGTCERCSSVVEKKPLRQWVLRITDYADRLLDDLDTLEQWPQWVKEAQRNWIGKSEGSTIPFVLKTKTTEEVINIFTTRADTLFGCTYFVLAPEHSFIHAHENDIENINEVKAYILDLKGKSEIERTAHGKEKTGVQLKGIVAINPANGEEVPVWIADYVLADYGTGAVMAVPAHDERDWAFAKKYDLPIKQVIAPIFGEKSRDAIEIRGSYGIIQREDGAVLMQENREWDVLRLVGGTHNEGETETEALFREVEEESGYQYDSYESVIVQNLTHFDSLIHKGSSYSRYGTIYLLDFNKGKQGTPDPEDYEAHCTYDWYTYEDLKKAKIFEEERWVIEQFFNPQAIPELGVLVGSKDFDGITSQEAKQKITEYVGGEMTKNYKLRDWVFSRQRYWGEPIPLVHVGETVYPIADEQLPVVLPNVESYEPTGTGESPLAGIDEWVNVSGYITDAGDFVVADSAPADKELIQGKRETNTMPQWAGSSWYYLRYMDPQNPDTLVDPAKEKAWSPIDVYVGGDHATRHLIYARFWHKFLFDIGVVSAEEPFPRLEFLGHILASDGQKISKRKNNGEKPDDIIERVGADSLRTYEMFIGPFEKAVPWSNDGVVGVRRFIEKVWRCSGKVSSDGKSIAHLDKTIKKVGEDIQVFKFNTAVSQMMICVNDMDKQESINVDEFGQFLKVLAPFAPHVTDEIWQGILGNTASIHAADWPSYDEAKTKDETITIGIQVNGKVRAEIELAPDAPQSEVEEKVLALEEIQKWIDGQEIKKFIYVPGRIISIVTI